MFKTDREDWIIGEEEAVKSEPEKETKKEEKIDNQNSEVANEGKKKYKLHPAKVIVPVVGGVGVLVALISGGFKIKHNLDDTKYDHLKDSDRIRTESIYDLVNTERTSIDELLDKSQNQYEAFENFRLLLSAKERFLDPKEYKLKEYNSFDYDYNKINYDRINRLNDEYYMYYEQLENIKDKTSDEYTTVKAQFDSVCVEMNSIRLSISKYEKDHGAALVEDIANKVLAAKVINNNNLDPEDVTNIRGTYKEDGTLKVSFDYTGDGSREKYTTTFKDESDDKVHNIATDLAQENLLDAMHETKFLAQDLDYDNMKTKPR